MSAAGNGFLTFFDSLRARAAGPAPFVGPAVAKNGPAWYSNGNTIAKGAEPVKIHESAEDYLEKNP